MDSVCGQIACPPLPAQEVLEAFKQFTALEDCEERQPSARLVSASARRYMTRALDFCQGQWMHIIKNPRIIDPNYSGLTDMRLWVALGASPIKVLWVDKMFSARYPDRPAPIRLQWFKEGCKSGLIDCTGTACNTANEALALLHPSQIGLGLDAVVTELQFQDGSAGLELIGAIEETWQNSPTNRPVFCLLTPNFDKGINAMLRGHSRTTFAPHHKPDEVSKKVCQFIRHDAAKVPVPSGTALSAVDWEIDEIDHSSFRVDDCEDDIVEGGTTPTGEMGIGPAQPSVDAVSPMDVSDDTIDL